MDCIDCIYNRNNYCELHDIECKFVEFCHYKKIGNESYNSYDDNFNNFDDEDCYDDDFNNFDD